MILQKNYNYLFSLTPLLTEQVSKQIKPRQAENERERDLNGANLKQSPRSTDDIICLSHSEESFLYFFCIIHSVTGKTLKTFFLNITEGKRNE